MKKEISLWKGLLFMIALILGAWLLGVIFLNITWFIDTANAATPADHAIGDFKSVTIRFKNDSELKLKTQWFINACDTLWREQPIFEYAADTCELRQIQEWLPSPAISIDTLVPDYYPGKYRVYLWDEIIVSSITCRTLLWPPQIIKELVIKKSPEWEAYKLWGEPLPRYQWADTLNFNRLRAEYDSLFMAWADSLSKIPDDTTEGKALLWYEEVKQ